MDDQQSHQDVIRCHLCEIPLPSMHCDICHEHLCNECEEKHLSDGSKEHYIVPFRLRGCTPKCEKHLKEICKLHCEDCNIPICESCVSSDEHKEHTHENILTCLTAKKDLIQKDLKEIENNLFPKLQEAATNIQKQRADQSKHSQKLRADINAQGEAMHKEINTIIDDMRSNIDYMDSEHKQAINIQEESINHTIKELSQIISDLRTLLDVNDVCKVSKYKTKNEEFKRVPDQFEVDFPTFTPQEINREHISKQFGFLTKLKITYPVVDECQITDESTNMDNTTLNSSTCGSDSKYCS